MNSARNISDRESRKWRGGNEGMWICSQEKILGKSPPSHIFMFSKGKQPHSLAKRPVSERSSKANPASRREEGAEGFGSPAEARTLPAERNVPLWVSDVFPTVKETPEAEGEEPEDPGCRIDIPKEPASTVCQSSCSLRDTRNMGTESTKIPN